jgi:hypothetical protein
VATRNSGGLAAERDPEKPGSAGPESSAGPVARTRGLSRPSGYPHLEEAYWFGEGVRPELRRRGVLAGSERSETSERSGASGASGASKISGASEEELALSSSG